MPKNGDCLVTHSSKTKPMLQISLGVKYGFARSRSGDMYKVVPTTVLFNVSLGSRIADDVFQPQM
eukprot:scaffold72297_cov48-Attheya_sp.AAC.2